MEENKSIRIDKFLWAVRIYKTRSIASGECRKGRVTINDIQVKPSRIVEADETLTVRKPPITYTYRIIEPIENRISAKLVPQFIEDITPGEEKAKLDLRYSARVGFREKGTGRPTKKERRTIDRINDDFNFQ